MSSFNLSYTTFFLFQQVLFNGIKCYISLQDRIYAKCNNNYWLYYCIKLLKRDFLYTYGRFIRDAESGCWNPYLALRVHASLCKWLIILPWGKPTHSLPLWIIAKAHRQTFEWRSEKLRNSWKSGASMWGFLGSKKIRQSLSNSTRQAVLWMQKKVALLSARQFQPMWLWNVWTPLLFNVIISAEQTRQWFPFELHWLVKYWSNTQSWV